MVVKKRSKGKAEAEAAAKPDARVEALTGVLNQIRKEAQKRADVLDPAMPERGYWLWVIKAVGSVLG
jgi:hypothetical protein